jgi:hypothetical protein
MRGGRDQIKTPEPQFAHYKHNRVKVIQRIIAVWETSMGPELNGCHQQVRCSNTVQANGKRKSASHQNQSISTKRPPVLYH